LARFSYVRRLPPLVPAKTSAPGCVGRVTAFGLCAILRCLRAAMLRSPYRD